MKWDLPDFCLNLEGLAQVPKEPFNGYRNQLDRLSNQFKKKLRDGASGFYDWPAQVTQHQCNQLTETARSLRNRTDGVIFFGIGGSHWGPITLLEALRPTEEIEKYPHFWLSNADPYSVAKATEFCKTRRPLAVVISKSGDTWETLCGFLHLSNFFNHETTLVITDPEGGSLKKLAHQNGWHQREIPSNIGGRFTVLTEVGLLPAEVTGLNAYRIVCGAQKTRKFLESCDPTSNPAYLTALFLYIWDVYLQHNLWVLMPYASPLESFTQWYVQLFAESLGKLRSQDKKPVGPCPLAALGTRDHHSLLQLFKQGTPNKVVGLVCVTEPGMPVRFSINALKEYCDHSFGELNQMSADAAERSLRSSAVPTYRIEIPKPTEEALGALFFFFEVVATFAAELYAVNAFDQPGVEEAKTLFLDQLRH